jgi:hypothetical protein
MLKLPCRVSGDNPLLALFTKIPFQFVSSLERGVSGIRFAYMSGKQVFLDTVMGNLGAVPQPVRICSKNPVGL